jgi:hypothetical protein
MAITAGTKASREKKRKERVAKNKARKEKRKKGLLRTTAESKQGRERNCNE